MLTRLLIAYLTLASLAFGDSYFNVGGPDYADGAGRTWSKVVSDGTCAVTQTQIITGTAIEDSDDDTMLQTGCKATSSISFTDTTIGSGIWQVTLYFVDYNLEGGNISANVNGVGMLSSANIGDRVGADFTLYTVSRSIAVITTGISVNVARVSADPYLQAFSLERVSDLAVGSIDPTQCGVGDMFYNTTVDGLKICDPTNTFTVVSAPQEEVEDFVGALIGDGTGTHTDITITYQDSTGDIDVVVDTLPNLTGTLDVNSGGTGATSLTNGGILLGSGTGVVTALGVAANGQIPIGDGTTDPVLATIAAEGGGEISVTNGVGTITLDVVESSLDLAAIGGSLGTGQVASGTWDFGTSLEANTLTEGGTAVPNTGDNLSVFAATTSAQLAGVLSNETGSGLAVFATAPTVTTLTVSAGGVAVDTGVAYGTGTGIKFGDGDMEIYESADDQLRFDPGVDSATGVQFLDADGGVPILNIDTTSERVGIGTASPGETFSVHAPSRSIDSTGNVSIFSTNSQGVDLGGSLGLGGLNGTAGGFDPWSFATLVGKKENATSSNLAGYFAVATANYGGTIAEMFRITSTGKVGVGIDAPTALLHVENDTPTTGTTRFLVGQGAADSDTTVLATVEGAITAKPGGSVPACELYTKTVSDLTNTVVDEDETLFNLPARGKLTGVSVKHTIAFSGGSVSAMTIRIGDSSSTPFYTAAFDIFQGVGDTVMQDTDMFKSSTSAARNVLARFTATGDTVDNLTAGSVGIVVCWVVLP